MGKCLVQAKSMPAGDGFKDATAWMYAIFKGMQRVT
jgi:hypothetical protein